MKTFTLTANRLFSFCALSTVAAGLFVFSACEKSDSSCPSSNTEEDLGARPVVKNNLVLPFFVEGANQEWWANLSDNDAIFEERMHNAVLAPDGHAVTWGEFNRAAGTARINCTSATTVKMIAARRE